MIEIQSCYTVVSFFFCYECVLVQLFIIVKEKVKDSYVTGSFNFAFLVDQIPLSMLYLRIYSNNFPAGPALPCQILCVGWAKFSSTFELLFLDKGCNQAFNVLISQISLIFLGSQLSWLISDFSANIIPYK